MDIEPLGVWSVDLLLDAEWGGVVPGVGNLARCALTTIGLVGVLALVKAKIVQGPPREELIYDVWFAKCARISRKMYEVGELE